MKPRAHLAVVNARLATLAGFSDSPSAVVTLAV